MRNKNIRMRSVIAALSLVIGGMAHAAGKGDDPLLYMLSVDKLELRPDANDTPFAWSAEGWMGKDLNKAWIKTEGQAVNGSIDSAEVQLLYSRAVSPFWDIQLGWRRDIRPQPNRDWLAINMKGLSPYFIDVDAGIFIGESGRLNARLDAEYDYLLTQRLILSPELSFNLFSKDDPEVGIGSGFSDMELGLRLRYEIRREFAPYIGINWEKKLGDTADYAEAAGEAADDLRFVIGIRAWF